MSLYPWISSYDAPLPPRLDVPDAPAFAMLDETAHKYGARPAFDFLGKRYDWAQIGDLVNRLACGLQSLGIGKGQRVGLFLPNCPYFLIAYYAVLKTGATVVNYNPLYAPRELAHQIEDSETDTLITLDLALLYDKAAPLLRSTRLKNLIIGRFADVLPFPKNILFPLLKRKEQARIAAQPGLVRLEDLLKNDGGVKPPAITAKDDIAVIQYTGGTTGTPKGAMLSHYNIYANALQTLSWFHDTKPGAVKLFSVLPFFHVFAMTTAMNTGVVAAAELITVPRFDLKQTLEIIHRKRPDFFYAVPAIYNAMNNHPELKHYDLTSLKYCISGGAPLPVEVKRAFESITGSTLVEGYGLTETSPVVCINPIWGENRPGSVGLPVLETIVEIIDAEDKTTSMPIGARGELCVRGPQVMKGYWKKPNETAEVLRDGRLYSGDIAVMDAQGYVSIVDRIKDMIIVNGYKVYPRNVEEAIYLHPAVEECIVAGIADDQRGEAVKAWIKLKTDHSLDSEGLREFLTDKISKMESPKIIEFRNEPLPKTMIGKLSKKDVLAQEKKV